METALVLASMRIGIIIRIAFALDMGDIADKTCIAAPRRWRRGALRPPNAPAEVQTVFLTGLKVTSVS